MLVIYLILLSINFLLFIFLIPVLRKLKFGQSIRKEGPKEHYKKSGTPTMGGIGIVLGLILNFIVLIGINKLGNNLDINSITLKEILILILPLFLYGVIGFIDDFLIVIKQNNNGLSPKLKFLFQLFIGTIVYWLYLDLGFENIINFFGLDINLSFFYGVLVVFMFVGSSNAANLTDGLDGLLGGVSLICYVFLAIFSLYLKKYLVFLYCISMVIVLISYLFFNLPKATIFMGDVGSLAIGASLVSVCIVLKIEVLLLVIGFVYIVETLSVILQVWFFKKTKGNRLFKMTPLHHHFELVGFNEWEINFIFWIMEIIVCIIGGFLLWMIW